MTDKPDGQQPVWPFVVIAFATCAASYPILVVLQLFGSSNWSDYLEVLYHTAIVLGCCWAMFSVALWIAWRTWPLWNR